MPLKMTPAHIAHLTALMQPLDTDARRAAYLAGDFPRAAQKQNLAKRYRWDLLYLTTGKPFEPPMKWVCDNLYPYLNDDHIDSALRQILAMDHRAALDPIGTDRLYGTVAEKP